MENMHVWVGKENTPGKVPVFVAAGHYPSSPGVVNGNFNLIEHLEAAKVVNELMKIDRGGFEYKAIKPAPLSEKVGFVNTQDVIFDHAVAIEVHFNSNEGAAGQGIETLYYPGSKAGMALATCLHDRLCDALPFFPRGIKERGDLYFLRKTTPPAVIIEVLFLNNDLEAAYLLYPRAHQVIAQAIDQGIVDYVAYAS